MQKEENKLVTLPIGRLLFQMTVPAVLGQLVHLLYNIVDRIYVGRIPEIGSLALAGLGVTFPIVLLISAFASLIGMGGAPRAAIAMGKGDQNTAEKLLGNSVTLLFIFSIILSLLFTLTKEPILLTFGASSDTLPYAIDYISIYLLGTIFAQATLGLNLFITNQGFAKTSMATVCIGCGLNIVLDPIFIFVFDMGVKGAALATIISQAVSAAWVLWFLCGKKSILRIQLKNLKLSRSIVGLILSLGVSAFIVPATECLIQLVFNRGMQVYGSDQYVALMSILFSLMQIVFMPLVGFSQGVQPIISYNYGAKRTDRVKKTLKLSFLIGIFFSAVTVGIIMLFPDVFIGLFTPDKALIELGKMPLRIYLCGMAVMGAQAICQLTFLALGQAKHSMFLAALRKIILLLPLALLLPSIGGFSVWGLFLAEPISDIIATTVTVLMFRKKIGLLLKRE